MRQAWYCAWHMLYRHSTVVVNSVIVIHKTGDFLLTSFNGLFLILILFNQLGILDYLILISFPEIFFFTWYCTSFFLRFYLFLERSEERERNIDQLPLTHSPTVDGPHNPGMCPDQESNWRPFHVVSWHPTNWATLVRAVLSCFNSCSLALSFSFLHWFSSG